MISVLLPLATRVGADTVMVELVGANSCALPQALVTTPAITSSVPAHQVRRMPDGTDLYFFTIRATNPSTAYRPSPCERNRS